MNKQETKPIQNIGTDADYTAWIQTRKESITGTDISAICSVNPYKTKLQLYLEKTDLNYKPKEQSAKMMLGLYLESFIAELFKKRKFQEIKKTDKPIVEYADFPVFKGSPDYLTTDASGNIELLEIKTKENFYNGIKTIDDLPLYWIYQCNWYCMILGLKTYHIAYLELPMNFNYEYFVLRKLYENEHILKFLLSLCKFDVITLQADDELIDFMKISALDFYENNILTGIIPEAETIADINYLYPVTVSGTFITADAVVKRNLIELKQIKADISALEKEKEVIELSLKKALKDSELILDENANVLATYKTTKTTFTTDIDKLQQQYPDIYDSVQKVKQGYKVLRIK